MAAINPQGLLSRQTALFSRPSALMMTSQWQRSRALGEGRGDQGCMHGAGDARSCFPWLCACWVRESGTGES